MSARSQVQPHTLGYREAPRQVAASALKRPPMVVFRPIPRSRPHPQFRLGPPRKATGPVKPEAQAHFEAVPSER